MRPITQTAPDLDAQAAASDALHARVRGFARHSLTPRGSSEQAARPSTVVSSGGPEINAIDQGWDDSCPSRDVAEVSGEADGQSPVGRDAFDTLACDIARYQAMAGVSLMRLLRSRGHSLSKLVTAADIPAIPSDAFRMTRISVHPKRLDVRTFRTSGTTSGARGEHALRTLATYREVATLWASRMLFPRGGVARVVALMPSPAELEDSSLAYMCELFGEVVGSESGGASSGASWHLVRGELDVESVETAIGEAREQGIPALLLGASFAHVHLLDALGTRVLPLPPDSRVMLTGGFKGKSREVSEDALRAALCTTFGVAPSALIGEYGMTELSSQAYERDGVASVYHAPPWMRVIAVDPVSLAPVPDGQVGIARIVDLANVDSAVVIQTQDRVRVIDEATFELLGRLEGGTPRGCSLMIEELLG